MTHPTTGTLTRTVSVTMTDVRHVVWRIGSDLRGLRAQYNMITAEMEEAVIADLTAFVYRGFIDNIEFRFLDKTTAAGRFRVQYPLTRARSDDRDDDSGGIRYRDLGNTDFSVIVTYSQAYLALPSAEREAFRRALKCSWGAAARIADGAGYWTTDRSYGSGALGASRSVFLPY